MLLQLLILFICRAEAQRVDGHLVFPPELNRITISNTNTDYDFTDPEGFKLGVFQYKYSDITVKSATFQQRSLEIKDSTYLYHRILGFFWPKTLVANGTLKVFMPYEDGLAFTKVVDARAFAEWMKTPQRLVEEQQIRWGDSKLRLIGDKFVLPQTNIGIHPINDDLQSIISRTFQFCVSQKTESFVKVCSPYFTKDLKGKIQLSQKTKVKKNLVMIDGQESALSGVIVHSATIDFKAQMTNGFTIVVSGPITNAPLTQILKSDKGIEVIGHGPPLAGAKMLDASFKIFEKLGWKDTIFPAKNYWQLTLPVDQPHVPSLSAGAGFIGRRIEAKDFPTAALRPKINRTVEATYGRKLKISGSCSGDCKLKALGLDRLEMTGNAFTWEAHVPDKHALNPVQLAVLDGDHTWVVRDEIFRASPTEIGARLTGIVTTDSVFSTIGEVSLAHWLEDVFGWESYWLSKQRWGLGLKYSQTFTDLLIAKGLDPEALSNLNFDIKYRFAPGVWGLHESFGIDFGYQQTQLGTRNLPLLGGGFFWAKSMPQIFDRILGLVPFMRYPKWVDMEILFFPLSLNKNFESGLIWNLNFHGKILWSKTFFGEAGFGVRSLDFIDLPQQKQVQFLTLYATLGMGVQF